MRVGRLCVGFFRQFIIDLDCILAVQFPTRGCCEFRFYFVFQKIGILPNPLRTMREKEIARLAHSFLQAMLGRLVTRDRHFYFAVWGEGHGIDLSRNLAAKKGQTQKIITREACLAFLSTSKAPWGAELVMAEA